MKAVRVLRYGPPSVVEIDDVPRPSPGPGQVLVRVEAAGVGPWDALFREGNSKLEPLPIILGSDISGTVVDVGPQVSGFKPGDEVYGSTNPQFSGGQAEYAVPLVGMIAPKPKKLNFIQAASVPVVAVTAWQMLFEYGEVVAGQTVLIHGGAGSVGAYAVQLAREAGLHIVATAGAKDLDYVRGLGAEKVLDYKKDRFEELVSGVDVVLDTIGGATQEKSLRVLKRGGILVSIVEAVPEAAQKQYGVRAAFFYAEVTTATLKKLTELIESGKLTTDVGSVLPLEQARDAHEMLAGAPHKRGKIVLTVSG